MAHEPIGVNPFAGLFASDSDLLTTTAAAYQHLGVLHH